MPRTKTGTKPKPPNKGARRRLKLLLIAFIGLLAYAGVTVWDQMGKFKEKTAEINQLEQKLQDTRKANEEAKKDIARMNDPEYRQEQARNDFGYAKQGETIYKLPKPSP